MILDIKPLLIKKWTLLELANYIGECLAQAESLARKSTIQFFRAGQALHVAHKHFKKKREWSAWLEKVGIARTTAWEAMTLCKKASEEEVAIYAKDEALRRFGVRKPRRRPENDFVQYLLPKIKALYPYSMFICEAYCPNMNGRIDVLQIDGDDKSYVWEFRSEELTGDYVNKTFGYMVQGEHQKVGYLVGKTIGSGAIGGATHILKKFDYNVKLFVASDFLGDNNVK